MAFVMLVFTVVLAQIALTVIHSSNSALMDVKPAHHKVDATLLI